MKPIPTLSQLYENIVKDLKSKLNISDDDLMSVLNAFSASIAGQFKLNYIYLGDIVKNLFPDTADLSEDGGELNRFGQLYLNRQPKPATNGYYIITLQSTQGSIIRNGLTYKSNDDSTSQGKLFISETEYTANGINDSILIRSLESGRDSLLSVGDELTITEPVVGTESTVVVQSVQTLPISSETIDDYRQKILDAMILEPQGGARTDYRLWSQDAQGVKRVYPYVKQNSPGTVQIFVEAIKSDSTDGLGTPSQTILDNVEEVIYWNPDLSLPIDERGRIPIQANPEILPITLRPVDIQIDGLANNNSSITNLVRTNLNLFLEDVRPFIMGADLAANKNDILYSGKMQSVLLETLGANNFYNDFKMFVDGQELNNFTFSLSNIPYLRNINYV